MAFDKQEYWDKRKSRQRGQGEETSRRIIKPTDPDYDREHFGVGSNLRQLPGAGIIFLNRKDARRRQPDRTGSKPNWRVRRRPSWTERREQSERDLAAATGAE